MRLHLEGRAAPARHLTEHPAGDRLDLAPGERCAGSDLGAWRPADRDLWPDPAEQA